MAPFFFWQKLDLKNRLWMRLLLFAIIFLPKEFMTTLCNDKGHNIKWGCSLIFFSQMNQCWFASKTDPLSRIICIQNWPTFRTQSYLPKWVGDWSDRRGITWNYSTLAPSWPRVFKGDIQTIGDISKHRSALSACWNHRASLRWPTFLDIPG